MALTQSTTAWNTYTLNSALTRSQFDRLVYDSGWARGRARRNTAKAALITEYTGDYEDVRVDVTAAIKDTAQNEYLDI